MNTPVKITLYTTLGCHLCELALHLLQQAQQAQGLELQIVEVEIADDDELMERYGIRIPVLRVANAELGWPFDDEGLGHFLGNISA
ncbi:MAG: glutaredoxin [Candidatus Azotimanducaceae bacterium]